MRYDFTSDQSAAAEAASQCPSDIPEEACPHQHRLDTEIVDTPTDYDYNLYLSEILKLEFDLLQDPDFENFPPR